MATNRTGRAGGVSGAHGAAAWIDRHFDDHLKALKEYLRLANLVTERERCEEVALRLKGEIEGLGGRASVVDYGDLPFVYGRLDAGADRTLVIYRNYDVVPPEGADWSAPPFAARVRQVDGLGECLVSRGACDPKGPLIGTLRAVEALLRGEGALPVNLIFLIEGDEQLGSPTLPKVIRERHAELREADAVLYPKLCQGRAGEPVLPLGVKGMLRLDLISAGGAWGGPARGALHSGNAAWVASPAWRLVRALGTLLDEDERVLAEGFYDDVVETIDDDAADGRIGVIEDQLEFLRTRHVLRFKHDLPAAALCRRYLGAPTFNIGNLLIHRSRPWSRLLLPCEARAQLDVRLVPDQDPETIVNVIRHHLKDHGFADVEVVTRLAYRPWSIDRAHPLVETTRRAYRAFGREAEVHPSSGTSQAFSLFDEIGLPLVVAGLGGGGRAFHTSEFATLQGLLDFEKSIARFIQEFARQEDGT